MTLSNRGLNRRSAVYAGQDRPITSPANAAPHGPRGEVARNQEQAPQGGHCFPAAKIRDTLVSASRAAAGSPGTLIGAQPGHRYFAVRWDHSGEVDLHIALDDIFFVQEGVSTLIYGAKLNGARQTAPGEGNENEFPPTAFGPTENVQRPSLAPADARCHCELAHHPSSSGTST